MAECTCVIQNREEHESERDWLKRIMCLHHWMQTDYYRISTLAGPHAKTKVGA